MLLVASPIIGEEEKRVLGEVVDSGWITMGGRVRAFEQVFAGMHGAPDAVAVSSCTAGLHLILLALGIGPGDEVLVPSLTFVASVNSILYTGATPVFVDIESLDLPLMSRRDAGRKLGPRTKAVVLVHYAGYVADRDGWRGFAREHGLFLVEDAAHAAGAPGAGTLGDATAYSFFGNKNMTTAEGGMVTAQDAELLARIRILRAHGMTSGTYERHSTRAPSYDVVALGFNYRMDEFRAAVGLVQLKRLPAWNEVRRDLVLAYRERLRDRCPIVGIPFASPGRMTVEGCAYHIMPVVLPPGTNRAAVMGSLHDAGIQTSVHYPAVHTLSFYRDRIGAAAVPLSEIYADSELTLPLHPGMTVADVVRVVLTLTEALRACDRVEPRERAPRVRSKPAYTAPAAQNERA